ncbi:MAG: MATE family efflux transporter [Clostridia bacterium]|nr:MATE family efflux transporter [Clostridia bacterium]
MDKKYFGTGAFYKQAALIALPVMCQSLIQNLVSLVDQFMVSGLGDVKMAGVNISGQILFVFMVLLNTICITGGIFMTQFFGADNKRGMRQTLCYKLIVSGVSVIVFMLVCMVFPRPVLSLMVVGNLQADAILDEGVRYMRVMGLVGVPMILANIFASSLRETGNVKTPLVISVIATLINTFMNWVLIYGNLGAPRLEVEGAAYATIIARVCEVALYIAYTSRRPQPFAVSLKDFRTIDWPLFRSILQKGGMVIFSEMTWVLSETITTALYNSRGGADVVSGMSCSFSIANLFFVAFSGMTTATSIIVGKSLGAGKLDQARQESRWLLTISLVFGLAMTGVGILTTALVPVAFASLSLASQAICRRMVFWMAIFMPAWVYQNAQFAISRAGGDTMMGVIVDVVCTVGIAIPAMFYMALCTDLGPVEMYIVVKAVDFIKIAVAWVWLKKERWVRNLTVGQAQ